MSIETKEIEETEIEIAFAPVSVYGKRMGLSVPTLYRLWEAKIGPPYVKFGSARRIPLERAKREWEDKLHTLDIEGALKALREKKASA